MSSKYAYDPEKSELERQALSVDLERIIIDEATDLPDLLIAKLHSLISRRESALWNAAFKKGQAQVRDKLKR